MICCAIAPRRMSRSLTAFAHGSLAHGSVLPVE
jgi:hypothetical protein